jgi:hypothetical protein
MLVEISFKCREIRKEFSQIFFPIKKYILELNCFMNESSAHFQLNYEFAKTKKGRKKIPEGWSYNDPKFSRSLNVG